MGLEDQQGVAAPAPEVTGGVGNGQATGTGQVSETFDMGKAVDSISEGLGFKTEKSATAPEVKPAEELVPPAAGTPKPPEQAAPEGAKPPVPVSTTEVAPKTWKPEAAALWAQVPEGVKAEIARREEDMHRGIEQYKTAATFGNAMQNELRPYEQLMKAGNINPTLVVRNVLNAQYQLATGTPETKVQLLRQLAADYKIDLGAVAGQPANNAYADPEVEQLRQQLAELKSGQTSLLQERQREEHAKAQTTVDAFASDKANVYFDENADHIANLLTRDRSLTLQQAYEQAMWANPVTRGKEIARQDAEKQAKAATEAKAAAAAALKAKGANVQVLPKAGAATLPLGTMDETLNDTLRDIKSRS